MARFPRSIAERQGVVRSMTQGAGGGRSAVVTPVPAPPPPMRAATGVTEAAEFSQYGAVTLTTTADAPEFVVGSRGGSGGLIDAGTLNVTTAGSSSTVVTIYVNGSSIGTITYASGDTTPQTDALTATRVVVGDRVKARVTTAGTGAKGLAVFVPIKP